MTKVLVIFTGGTIGSVQEDGVRTLHAANAPGESPGSFLLIEQYRRQHPNTVEFVPLALAPPYLSENATVSCWSRLLNLLKTVDFDSDAAPAGVIITHGTDTLAYAAAFLSVLLAHVQVPVLLVSSGQPLAHRLANGHKNFADAVSFIQNMAGKMRGVFVPYSYDLRKTVLYPGECITQSQPFIHRFENYDGLDFGCIEDGAFHAASPANAAAVQQTNLPGGVSQCAHKNGSARMNMLNSLKNLDNCVLLVTPYVGLDYARINLDEGGIRAVLHATYHSFTMCASVDEDKDKTSSAKWFFAQCAKRDIPLYFASCDGRRERYESADIMQRLAAPGADGKSVNSPVFILHSSLELAYAKLLVGHSIQKGTGILPKELRGNLNLVLLSDNSHVDNSFTP